MTVQVSDHALVRFLERVGGLDFSAVRAQIAASLERAQTAAAQIGECDFVVLVDRHRFVVRGGVLVTITVDTPRRSPGAKRPRAGEAEG